MWILSASRFESLDQLLPSIRVYTEQKLLKVAYYSFDGL